MFDPWYASMMLAFEANDVIRMRLMKIAKGGSEGCFESQLMVQEKIEAAMEASNCLFWGGTPGAVIDGYRAHVQANAERLREHHEA
jgi:hypothetical protein